MRYVHTNIIAKDWRKVSKFYQDVFECQPTGNKRDLSGQWIEDLTGIENVHIEGEHLAVPGYGDTLPTLEIFSYNTNTTADKVIDMPGFAHIAFEVDDVYAKAEEIIQAGGALVGKIVERDYGKLGMATMAYTRDIEGNIVEIQNWKPLG